MAVALASGSTTVLLNPVKKDLVGGAGPGPLFSGSNSVLITIHKKTAAGAAVGKDSARLRMVTLCSVGMQ